MKKSWLEKESDETKECTFKPDMTYTDEFLKSVNKGEEEWPVEERAKMW